MGDTIFLDVKGGTAYTLLFPKDIEGNMLVGLSSDTTISFKIPYERFENIFPNDIEVLAKLPNMKNCYKTFREKIDIKNNENLKVLSSNENRILEITNVKGASGKEFDFFAEGGYKYKWFKVGDTNALSEEDFITVSPNIRVFISRRK